MRSKRTNRTGVPVLLALVLSAAPLAAATPDWVNYQGVLRDIDRNPREGSAGMVFRFYDAQVGGNEILVDQHLASGTGAVQLSNGLFTVALGSGEVTDGSAVLPGDPYTSLAAVFRDFPLVYMEIEISAGGPPEVLEPRIHIRTAPYAFQSDHASEADDAINADLALEATYAWSAGTAGTADSATDSTQLGGLPASSYLDTTTTAQTKSGSLTVNGSLVAGGNSLRFAVPGAEVSAFPTLLALYGGDQPADDLVLQANLVSGNGSVIVEGQGPISLRTGNGTINFMWAGTSAPLATLDGIGNFTAEGALEAAGGILRFGTPGPALSADSGGLSILGGDSPTDDIVVRAGSELGDGAIRILGDQDFWMHSGDGTFRFVNGATAAITATLLPAGDFSVAGNLTAVNDLVALGNDVRFTAAGARVTASSTGLELQAGDANTDSLFLRAGNELTDGAVDILGDGNLTLRSGNGTFQFSNGATGVNIATLGGTGSLSVGEDMTAGRDVIVGGYEVHLGAPGSTRIVRNPATDDFYIARDEDQNNAASTFSIFTNIGIQQMRIGDGDEADALFDDQVVTNGIDYAEAFWITDPTLEAGEVVQFDPERPGYIVRSAEAYSNRAAGVISTRPGFLTGGSFEAEEASDPALAQEMKQAYAARDYATAKEIGLVLEQKKKEQQRPVALVGRLPVKVDASYGVIAAGDHLTSSPTPGHAMRMDAAGPSIGIALEDFAGKGRGTILAFVQRGHYTPTSLITETQEAQARLADTVAQRTPEPSTGLQRMPADLQLVLDASGEEEARFSVFRDGEAEEPRSEVFRVDERGNVWAQGAFRPRSMDVAEAFRVSEPVEPGDALVVDREHPGRYARSRQAADPAVVGVVAADPGVLLGGDVSRLLAEFPDLAEALREARRSRDRKAERAAWDEIERRFRADHAAVALTGTVTVKVDASYGAIAAGDLLVASPTPGHAMRASETAPMGAVFGKALESFAGGAGAIRMLVMLR